MIEELKNLLRLAREPAAELIRLDKMAAESKRVLKAAAETGDIESAQFQRRVTDAHVRLDLAQSRRGHVESESYRLGEALRDACRQEAKRWDRLVLEAKEGLAEARIQANLPYWEGEERACRRYYRDREDVPVFQKFNRAFAPDIGQADDPVQLADRLIAHINRSVKALGWTQEQAARIPAERVPGPKQAAEPRRVKVRAREDVVIPALEIKSDPHDKRANFIKQGHVVEIGEDQHRALSRFFEPVEETSTGPEKQNPGPAHPATSV